MPPSAPLTRLALQLGTRRLDVALLPDVAVGDALWASGVDAYEPGVLVLDSTGRAVDLEAAIGEQVPDGGVLHVIGPAPGPRGRQRRGPSIEVLSRRPPVQAALFVIGGVGALALAATALLGLGRGVVAIDGVAAQVIAILAVTAALCTATVRSVSGAVDDAATFAAPALGFAAGVLLVEPDHAAARQLAIVVGLVVACIVAAARHVVARYLAVDAARRGVDDLAVVVLATLGIAAGLFAVILLAGLPAVAGAALLIGFAPLGLTMLPSLSVDVPDEQLIDLAHVSRTAATVRGAPPRALGQVNRRVVVGTVTSAERRKSAGTVVLSCLPPLLGPLALTAPSPGGVPRWGLTIMLGCVVIALALLPRVARDPSARWVPRIAAGVVVIEMMLLGDLVAGPRIGVVAVIVLVVALIVVAVSVPLGRGWRTVAISRLADGIERLALVLALPAAFVAADAITILRQLASG